MAMTVFLVLGLMLLIMSDYLLRIILICPSTLILCCTSHLSSVYSGMCVSPILSVFTAGSADDDLMTMMTMMMMLNVLINHVNLQLPLTSV